VRVKDKVQFQNTSWVGEGKYNLALVLQSLYLAFCIYIQIYISTAVFICPRSFLELNNKPRLKQQFPTRLSLPHDRQPRKNQNKGLFNIFYRMTLEKRQLSFLKSWIIIRQRNKKIRYLKRNSYLHLAKHLSIIMILLPRIVSGKNWKTYAKTIKMTQNANWVQFSKDFRPSKTKVCLQLEFFFFFTTVIVSFGWLLSHPKAAREDFLIIEVQILNSTCWAGLSSVPMKERAQGETRILTHPWQLHSLRRKVCPWVGEIVAGDPLGCPSHRLLH
jgi:hypothetical protein